MDTDNTKEIFINLGQSGKVAGEIGQASLSTTKRKSILFISPLF
jgi:uncharacterized protein YuzE